MKVFLSWSGETSRQIAAELKQWLPLVVQDADCWMSEDDIEKGSRGIAEIAKSLEATDCGILCVTPENLSAPWLMFEAGALAKSVEKARVVPLLFRLAPTDLKGPISQFQAAVFSPDDMFRVVRTINSLDGAASIPEDRLKRIFDKFWSDLVGRHEQFIVAHDRTIAEAKTASYGLRNASRSIARRAGLEGETPRSINSAYYRNAA